MIDLSLWQWGIGAVAALLLGMSKAGLLGLSLLAIALFTAIVPARESSGAVLPLLIVGDLVALAVFRRHAQWPQLVRVFPWAAVGVVAGAVALGRMTDQQVRTVVGGVIIALTVVQVVRRYGERVRTAEPAAAPTAHPVYTAAMGMGAGVATMIANSAGPIMLLYLLAMRLPKLAFIGTSAWFFFVINVFKVPFSVQLGLIDAQSLWLDLVLVPLVVVGALGGRWLVHRINQEWFERIALLFAFLGGVRLLL